MSVAELNFEADEIVGYEAARISLNEESDGPLCATLVRRQSTAGEYGSAVARPAVLYLHGFVDYFFQTHLAERIEAEGFAFYALDLRRYGRSLHPQNHANQANHVSDYFQEIDHAVSYIMAGHPEITAIVAHSTGGLIASHYLKSGERRSAIKSLILNSPFFRFNLPPLERALTWLAAHSVKFIPSIRLPQRLPAAYGKSLHTSHGGTSIYDLDKKPLAGFPLYTGWFRMIREAQAQVRKGLGLELPILALHSSHSHRSGESPLEADYEADIVLNRDDMRLISPKLGKRVQTKEIQHGVHDLVLSREPARSEALDSIVQFLKQQRGESAQ